MISFPTEILLLTRWIPVKKRRRRYLPRKLKKILHQLKNPASLEFLSGRTDPSCEQNRKSLLFPKLKVPRLMLNPEWVEAESPD